MTKPRWLVVNARGRPPDDQGYWSCYAFLTQIGDYDVLTRRFGQSTSYQYGVVCDPARKKRNHWNYTGFDLDAEGNIVFSDNDVELDPYHMCLLYQAIDEHRKSRGEQPLWST